MRDVVDAGILPAGALSVICGSSAGLLDQLQSFDVLSFTGSAETAAVIRSHPAVTQHSVRVNIEADSLNSALLLPGEAAGSESFDLLVKEVAREMTVKSGQKCTAIRRVFVPEAMYAAAAQAISARLAKTSVGNPRNESVRMGALVNRKQRDAVLQGLDYLKAQTEVLHDGQSHTLVDADAASCCVGPTLLRRPHPAGYARRRRQRCLGPRAHHHTRCGGPAHRPRQCDAAVPARRPRPCWWRRRAGGRARPEFLPPPQRAAGQLRSAGAAQFGGCHIKPKRGDTPCLQTPPPKAR